MAQSYQITWKIVWLKSFCVVFQTIFCLSVSLDAVRIKLLKCHIRCQCHGEIQSCNKSRKRPDNTQDNKAMGRSGPNKNTVLNVMLFLFLVRSSVEKIWSDFFQKKIYFCEWEGTTSNYNTVLSSIWFLRLELGASEILPPLEAAGNRRSCRRAWSALGSRLRSTQVTLQSLDIKLMSRRRQLLTSAPVEQVAVNLYKRLLRRRYWRGSCHVWY